MLDIHVSEGLPKDPHRLGWVIGWGVLIHEPARWVLAAVHRTEVEAKADADRRGDGFQAVKGSHRLGTDEFMLESNTNS